MADFNGKFQYLDAGGSVTQEGPCRLQFDSQNLTLTPQSGAPLVFDLGDLDAVTAADYEIRLLLYTGKTLLLRQFAKAYETLAHDLLDSYRGRLLQCLLLEDMEEIDRFPGSFELAMADSPACSGPAEIRLFKSNLAVLPAASQGFQWRLADIDDVAFDSANYEVALKAGPDQLKFTRLAKRTEEFVSKLREAIGALAAQSSQALHSIFPFLNPDQLQSTATLLREGQAAAVSRLAAINSKTPIALTANAVDKSLKPYYEDLVAQSAGGMLYAGFKLIRPEDKDSGGAPQDDDDSTASAAADDAASAASDDSGQTAPDNDSDAPEVLYWFFFPIAAKPGASQPANVVAWEASSRSGRATYFFRLLDPAQARQLSSAAQAPALVESAVRRLNRVLGMLNFRRRPIYLTDDQLEMDPKFHRYAISARRIPELRQVRASFLGRASHTSHEAWQTQVKNILAKAGV